MGVPALRPSAVIMVGSRDADGTESAAARTLQASRRRQRHPDAAVAPTSGSGTTPGR